MLFDAGQRAEALPMMRKIVEIRKVRQGDTHLKTLHAKMNLGAACRHEKLFDEAIAILEPVRALLRKQLGDTDYSTLFTTANLAICYGQTGRRREERELLAQVHRDRGKFNLRWASEALVAAYRATKMRELGIAVVKELVASDRASLDKSSPELANRLSNCGLDFMRFQAWTDAEDVLEQAHAIRVAQEPDRWSTFHTK